MRALYDSDQYYDHRRLDPPPHRYRERAQALSRAVHGQRLLDVGCGTGGFLAAMCAAGWTGVGLEVSGAGRRRCEAKGLTVWEGTLEDVARLNEAPFDLVTALHVLEHIEEPRSALRSLYEVLAPGGTLWIEVPNREAWTLSFWPPARRHLYDLPHHLHHFTKDSLQKSLEEAGFHPTTVDVSVPTFAMSVLDALGALRGGGRPPAPPASFQDQSAPSGPVSGGPRRSAGARVVNWVRARMPGYKLTAHAVRPAF